MTKQIFLSYAKVDGLEFTERLYHDLVSRGYKVWLDRYSIIPGTKWDDEIDKGLYSSSIVIVVLTPGAVESQQVKSEWSSAFTRFVPILPLLVQSCDIPRMLSVIQYIDFIDNYEKGLANLQKALNNIPTEHIQMLEHQLQAFLLEQSQSTEDSRRYQSKIDALRVAIDSLKNKTNTLSPEPSPPTNQKKQNRHVKIVGRRPYALVDHFKDRVQERSEIHSYLEKQSNRLISIIGHGGMGKTAVASKVLAELENEKNSTTIDGIVYMSTRSDEGLITLEKIIFACAKLLESEKSKDLIRLWLSMLPLREKLETFFEMTNEKNIVILLDNLDDLELGVDAQLVDDEIRLFCELLCTSSKNIRVLITTRIPIQFNHITSRFARKITLNRGLPLEDGIDLLRELDPTGEQGLRDETDVVLAQAVQRVHGMPRALELISFILAQDPFMTLGQLLEDFYKHETIVERLAHDAYKRLDNDARQVMQALAVFGRPVPINTLNNFFIDMPNINVLEIIKRLTRHHLITFDRGTSTIALHPIDSDYIYGLLAGVS
jgi:hypothetical protein